MDESSLSEPVALGIDFGGTTVKLGLVQAGGLTQRAESLPTLAFERADDLLAAILSAIDDLRAMRPDIVAIGAGLPGIVDSRRGIVHHLTNVPGWVNVPLRDLLCLHTGLPAVIENDANAMTYAEWKFGAGRDKENVVCVTLGTGVGAGLILDGSLYRGAQLGAGEVGHMSIDYRGVPGAYGNFGGLEEYVGNGQIAARAALAYAAAGETRHVAGMHAAPAGRGGAPWGPGGGGGLGGNGRDARRGVGRTWSGCSTRMRSCWAAAWRRRVT